MLRVQHGEIRIKDSDGYHNYSEEKAKKMKIPLQIHTILSEKPKQIPNIDYDSAGFKKLYPFQKESVKFIINKCGGRGIIADEMGLGKTFQALSLIELLNCKSLVICPASLRQNWKCEYERFSSSSDMHIMKNVKSGFGSLAHTVVSYGIISRIPIQQIPKHFDFIIIDESHYIKNNTSKRTKTVLKLCKRAKYVVLLSGTPMSRTADLFTQLKAVAPSKFKDFYPWDGKKKSGVFYFADRYCSPQRVHLGRNKYVFKFSGATNLQELSLLVEKYMVRRTKENVLSDLPPKVRRRIELDTLKPSDAKRFERELGMIDEIREKRGTRAADIILQAMVRQTSDLKIPLISKYLTTYFENPSWKKTLIFAHHHSMVDSICNLMESRKLPFINIDGRTKASDRQTKVDKFQSSKHPMVAVLGISSAGTGLTFNTASTVLMAELVWSNMTVLQAEDRSHRIGQKNKVNIYYLVLPGSTDDVVWRSIQSKIRGSKRTLESTQKEPSRKRVKHHP